MDFGKPHELNIGSQLIPICIRKMRDILKSDLIKLSHNSIDFRCIPLFKIVLIQELVTSGRHLAENVIEYEQTTVFFRLVFFIWFRCWLGVLVLYQCLVCCRLTTRSFELGAFE